MRTTLPCLGAAVLFSTVALSTAAFAQAGPDEEPLPPSIRNARAGSEAPAEDVSASMTPGAPPPATGPSDALLPSLYGPIGLYRVSTAEVGPQNHLRLALHGQYFSGSQFLINDTQGGDHNTRVDGALTFGFTPNQYFELFGALLTSSNRNERASEAGRRDPPLIKSFGDLVLGSKLVLPLAPGMALGFELGLRFLSSISDLSISPSSTSMWIGPLYTLDLRPGADIPLRFHANANFYLDNSKNLFDFSNTTLDTREVAMFAYGIAFSRMRFALGIDAPLEKLTAPIPLQPFVEYHAEIVTASADPAFMGYMPDNRDQQWMTFGLRARAYRGLTFDAGVDVRLRAVGYQYGPPLSPYNILFGVNYALDVDSFRRPVVVTRTVEKMIQPPPPDEGRIAGAVKDAKDGKPIPGAIVAIKGRPRARVATDPDGTFLTGPLPPGPAELEISAPSFDGDTVHTAVTAGTHPAEVTVSLTPKILTGNVRGRVTDSQGRGLEASVRFVGVESFEAKADSSGAFSAALPAGPYKVTAESIGLPKKDVPLDIVAGQDRQLEISLRPPNPNITLIGDAITLKDPIKFKSGTPKLDPKFEAELSGVADLLGDHPEIRTLRVEAHWDTSAGKNAQELTGNQAWLIKDYLVKKGIPEGRLEAVGLGADKPLVPNIGPANKAKNRRVELHTVN